MRYLNISLAGLMLMFAAVQYNDPDGLLWISIYSIPTLAAGTAGVCVEELRKPGPTVLLLACLIAAAIGTIYYWPTVPHWWRKDVWVAEETAREGMGMMIATIVITIAWFSAWPKSLSKIRYNK